MALVGVALSITGASSLGQSDGLGEVAAVLGIAIGALVVIGTVLGTAVARWTVSSPLARVAAIVLSPPIVLAVFILLARSTA